MKKMFIVATLMLGAHNLFAYQTLSLAEYREQLNQQMTITKIDCENQSEQLKQGVVYETLKGQYNLSDEQAQICNKDYSRLIKRFCQRKIQTLQIMQSYTTSEKLNEIRKGFSVHPASSALGAVVLYKSKKDLQSLQSRSMAFIDRHVNRSNCDSLKKDVNMKQYLNDFFNEQYNLFSATTLNID